MNRTLPLCALVMAGVLTAHLPVGAADAPSGAAPSRVRDLAERVSAPNTEAGARQAALAELQHLASGDRTALETRESTFALAEILSRGARAGDPDSLRARLTAVTLYPDDPRATAMLLPLADEQRSVGDHIAAHASYSRLLRIGQATVDAGARIRAADNALEAGDAGAALVWSRGVDVAALPVSERAAALLVQLKAAEGGGDLLLAFRAAELLERDHDDALRLDAQALWAAARIDESRQDLVAATAHYEAFANIHVDAKRRPAALLALGRLYARQNRTGPARRTFDWLVSTYPQAPESATARVELLELEGASSIDETIRRYTELARGAPDASAAVEATDRLFDKLFDRGHVLAAASSLAAICREEGGLAPLAARQTLSGRTDAVLGALAARRDDLGLAAVAATIAPLDIPVSSARRSQITAARERLGLGPAPAGRLGAELERVRTAARAGRWDEVETVLVEALGSERDAPAATTAVALRMLAEALWRLDRAPEAMARIEGGLALELSPALARPLRVLRADMLFASGRVDEACADYRTALVIEETPWVRRQLGRCTNRGELTARSDEP